MAATSALAASGCAAPLGSSQSYLTGFVAQQNINPVFYWTDIILQAVRDQLVPPPLATRGLAMGHVAGFLAANGTDPRYQTEVGQGPVGADPEVAYGTACAVAIAEHLGHERPHWELSLAELAAVIRTRPEGAFAPKHRWAMDWYYPVLSGAVTGDDARAHLAERHDVFVMDGLGVRCVSDRPWVTAAETCECLIAYLCVGERDLALDLFTWAQDLRTDEGRYWTGKVHPDGVHFPGGEQSTYTAAAIGLAADAVSGASPASGLLSNHAALPDILDLGDQVRDSRS